MRSFVLGRLSALTEGAMVALIVAMVVALTGLIAVTTAAGRPTASPHSPAVVREIPRGSVPGRVLVRYVAGTSQASENAVMARVGASRIQTIADLGVHVLQVPVGREDAIVTKLAADHSVRYAEREGIAAALDTTPNDPYWAGQKSTSLGQVNVGLGWDATTGASNGPTVAVVDTGVAADHPDLAGKVSSDGWNFVANNSNTADDNGHGTMVAGVIAADANNGTGMAGLCWGCAILPVKVLDASGSGSYSAIASGITYAVDHGAKVINLSLGGTSGSSTLKNAVDYATGKGALVVAASGNNACNCVMYPAQYALAIGSVDKYGVKYDYSDWGATLDLVAPGTNWATYWNPTYPTQLYTAFSGTSSATPVVAGLAALLLAQDPSRTPAALTDRLEETARDLGAAGRDDLYGYGVVDFAAALGAGSPAPTPTPAPTASPSPTPAPSPSATPAPTATPTPSATPSPTATLTATPTATTTPTPTPSPTPTPTPTATPTPGTATTTFTGSLSAKQTSRTFTVISGAGIATATLKVSKGSGVTVSLLAPDGTVLATSQGTATSLTVTVPAGTCSVRVSGNGSRASFSVTVTYPTP